jgi:hypothetical protein
MLDVAVLAVGLALLLTLRPGPLANDVMIGVLGFLVACVLAVAADRALFARARRAFWLGFAATAWLCAALAMAQLYQVRRYLLEYGPPVVRARQEFIRRIAQAHMAQAQGLSATSPARVPEWYLLASALTETALGLSLGLLVAVVGGLLAALVARSAARIGAWAEGVGVPNPSLPQRPPSPAPRDAQG